MEPYLPEATEDNAAPNLPRLAAEDDGARSELRGE
jgi:hypothetical protein